MKSVFLALLGLVATVSAADRIQIGLKNYLKLSTPKSLFKSFTQLKNPGDPTQWGSCDADGGFKVDFSNTYAAPEPPVMGQNVQLNLAGTFTDTATLTGINVYVTWNDTPLYVNDFARDAKTYNAGDAYSDSITWLIPSFAPHGHYHAELTLHDGSNKKLSCSTADFDL
jgi:ML domain